MHRITDHEIEMLVSRMLRIGVTLSALVVLAGGLLSLSTGSTLLPAYSIFHPELPSVSLRVIITRAASLDPASVIQLGLLLLIATPVARVALCVVGFARQRDGLYVAVSSVVLLIIIYSLSQGGR